MSSTITPRFLLEGAVFALEQCGLLLRDAIVLCRSGSYASAVVLTAFAREELGHHKILLDMRKEALNGKQFTIDEIQARCDDHVSKQRAGMLSTVFRDTFLRNLLQLRVKSHPQSAEWTENDAELTRILKAKNKRVPGDRHRSRISALYVEPISEHRWNRPTKTTPEFARQFMNDAVSDYAVRYERSYITSDDPILKRIDLELYTALGQWTDRPKLQQPQWLWEA